MTNLRQITLKDFSGGLNTTADKTRVKPNESPDLLNIEVLDSGAIVRRRGRSQHRQVGTGTVDFIDRYTTAGNEYLITHEMETGDVAATVIEASDEPPITVTVKSLNPTLPSEAGVYFVSGDAVKITEPTSVVVPAKPGLTIHGVGGEYTVANGGDTVTSSGAVAELGATTGVVTVTPSALNSASVRVKTSSASPGWIERFRDDFDRADSVTIGNGWLQSIAGSGPLTYAGLSSGKAVATGGDNPADYSKVINIYHEVTAGYTRAASATVTSSGYRQNLWVGMASTNAPTYDNGIGYNVYWQAGGSNNFRLYKSNGTTSTVLGQMTQTLGSGDTLRIERNATSGLLSAYINGVLKLSTTDTTYMTASDTRTYGIALRGEAFTATYPYRIDDVAVYENVTSPNTGSFVGSAQATIPMNADTKQVTAWYKMGAVASSSSDETDHYVGLYNGLDPHDNIRFRVIATVTNRTATTATVTMKTETFVASGTFREGLRGWMSVKGSPYTLRAINSSGDTLSVGETRTDTYPIAVTGLTASVSTIQATFYARTDPYGSSDEIQRRTMSIIVPALVSSSATQSMTVCGYRHDFVLDSDGVGSTVKVVDPSGDTVHTATFASDMAFVDSSFDVAGTTIRPTKLLGTAVTLPTKEVATASSLTFTQSLSVSTPPASVMTYIDRVLVNGAPKLRATTDYDPTGDYTTVASDTTEFRTSDVVYLDMFSYGGTQGGTGIIATLEGDFVGTQINSLYHYATTDTDGTHTAANKLYSFNGTIPDPINPTVRFAADPNNVTPSLRTYFGANAMARKQDRLFVAGKDVDASIMEYSAVNDTTKWAVADGGGALRPTPPGTGDATEAMVLWKDMLIWAGARTISAIKTDGDPTEWTVAELTQSFGCVAGKSMAATPNGIVFLSQGGVVAYGSIPSFGGDGEGFSQLSEGIRRTIERINVEYRHLAVGEYFDGRYYLSVPLDSSTVNNYTLVLKFADTNKSDDLPSWTLYDYGVASMYKTDSSLLAGGYDGWVYQLESGHQDDVSLNGLTVKSRIKMRYETPLVGLTNSLKDYREVYIATDGKQGQDFTFTTATDDTVDTPVITYTSPGDTSVRRFPHRKRGNSVSLKIEGSSSVSPATITDITVTYNERKR